MLADTVQRSPDGRRAYTERDVDWIVNCARFRASGMPVATIRRFTEMVRSGPGNEHERLDLLREHRQLVIDRIAELSGCLELIRDKVSAYETALEEGTAANLWHESHMR